MPAGLLLTHESSASFVWGNKLRTPFHWTSAVLLSINNSSYCWGGLSRKLCQ